MYETHATTTDNEAGIATGWLPGELSDQGVDDARELGKRRRGDRIDAVYTSDLARAVTTAEIAFAGRAIPIFQDWRLRECNYGELNGAGVARIDAGRRHGVDVPFPGGESYRDVADRTADLLHDLVRERDGQRVLLIAHSANRWALQHLLLGIPLEDLVDAPFAWQPGWEFTVPGGWRSDRDDPAAPAPR